MEQDLNKHNTSNSPCEVGSFGFQKLFNDIDVTSLIILGYHFRCIDSQVHICYSDQLEIYITPCIQKKTYFEIYITHGFKKKTFFEHYKKRANYISMGIFQHKSISKC